MATIRATVKYSMMQFPTLFANPVDVLVQLFCVIGNGYQWNSIGELVSWGDQNSEEFLHPVMRYEEPKKREFDDSEYLRPLHVGFKLKEDAFNYRCKFIEDNIDSILDAPLTNVYFGGDPEGYYFIKGIFPKYALAFNFPDNINKEWGDVLYAFINYWLTQLNGHYGVNPEDYNDQSFWPENTQKGYAALIQARARLYPLIHNGESYEEMVKRSREIMREFLEERKNKNFV